MSAILLITDANGHSVERSLALGSYEIGRDFGEIPLSDPNISARHARLDVTPAQVTIVDLGSHNGTRDASGALISGQTTMLLNHPFHLGTSALTLVRRLPVAGGTRAMAAVPLTRPPAAQAAAANAPVSQFRMASVPVAWNHLAYVAKGRTVRFSAITGTVLASSTHTRSYVSGQVINNQVSISTQVDVKREFLLRRDDTNVEEPFQLSNVEVIVREGQRLSILTVWPDSMVVGMPVRLIHHEAERYYVLNGASKVATSAALAKGALEILAMSVAVFFIGAIILAIVASVLFRVPGGETLGGVSIGLLFIGMPIVSIIYCIRGFSKSSAATRALDQHINGVAVEVLKYIAAQKRGLATS